MPLLTPEYASPRPPLEEGELGWAGYPEGVVLGPWPIDLGDLHLDRVDEFGGMWNVTAFTGRGSPPTAIETTQRVNAHGAWIGGRFWAAKPYTIDIAYEGEGPAERWAAEQRLLASVGVHDTTMVMHEEVASRSTSVILNGEVTIDPVNTDAFTAQVPLLAVDPFRYGVDAYEEFTHLPSTTGGLSWPATWPATWDGVVSSGAMTIYNEGSELSLPTFYVYGPLGDFTLAQPETGDLFALDLAADGESLADGEWVEVDMKRQRVMLLGQSSRRRSVRGNFFGLPPGPATVRFGSSSYNPTAFVSVRGFSTWI